MNSTAAFGMPRKPTPMVIDATLREGAQAPGVTFSVEHTTEIAEILMELGIDMVECGHPYVSMAEAKRVRAVVGVCGGRRVLAHARARIEDVESVKEAGAQWVGIFAGVNEISENVRFSAGSSPMNLIGPAIRRAKEIGLKVRFSVEDASRTELQKLVAAYSLAVEAGADRVCFADTVGVMSPLDIPAIVRHLTACVPEVPLEAHFHDDRGLAMANALAALDGGASWISSSVNGLGERCGITDTITLLANLHFTCGRPLPRPAVMQHASRLVQGLARVPMDSMRPIVGRAAFTHTADLHKKAVSKDSHSYNWISPAAVGRQSCIDSPTLPSALGSLVNTPKVISATELRHHRAGPGSRYVMIDDRVVPDARQYAIVRKIPRSSSYGPAHVDRHRHHVDSLFLFVGDEENLSGLRVEVSLGDERFVVDSPASVFIPSGVSHSYGVLSGGGIFVNQVLAGEYNSSLLDRFTNEEAILAALAAASA